MNNKSPNTFDLYVDLFKDRKDLRGYKKYIRFEDAENFNFAEYAYKIWSNNLKFEMRKLRFFLKEAYKARNGEVYKTLIENDFVRFNYSEKILYYKLILLSASLIEKILEFNPEQQNLLLVKAINKMENIKDVHGILLNKKVSIDKKYKLVTNTKLNYKYLNKSDEQKNIYDILYGLLSFIKGYGVSPEENKKNGKAKIIKKIVENYYVFLRDNFGMKIHSSSLFIGYLLTRIGLLETFEEYKRRNSKNYKIEMSDWKTYLIANVRAVINNNNFDKEGRTDFPFTDFTKNFNFDDLKELSRLNFRYYLRNERNRKNGD